MEGIVKNRFYLTPLLDALPRVVPEGMTLENFAFKKGEERTSLTMSGIVYSGNSDKESGVLNAFVARLKDDSVFSKYFKEISLSSKERKEINKASVTAFTISCQDSKKGKESR